MPAFDAPSLGKSALNEFLHGNRPAVVCPATDVVSPIDLLVGIDKTSRSVTARVKPGGPGYLQNWASATRDPWLLDTLSTILTFRSARDGWDGDEAKAPSRVDLGAAEMLASFLATYPDRLRPVLSVDVEGRPTYAINTGKFYLHLTIDPGRTLTWYAEIDGKEYFEDGVHFDGRGMPVGLKELFAAAV
ncbi:hypothetical protein FHR71_003650 [Methylobacterium sp. RAS18]|nr:hypothetical protein [Methylobacterium sp. RAS18]